MVPSAATATPRGPRNCACEAGPSASPADPPATGVTTPALLTRTIRSPSTTIASAPAAATATGRSSARVTVDTRTPGRYCGRGVSSGSAIGLSAAGPKVPSPANREERLATSCCTRASHLPTPASACAQVMLPEANTIAPPAVVYVVLPAELID